MQGWISLHRKLMDKAFYSKDSEKVHLWIHLLLKANHKGKEEEFNGKIIHCKAGQFTIGRKQLSEETGINESKIQRTLKYFEKIEHQIEQQTCSKNRLITIVGWSEYQKNEHQIEQQVNSERTASEQQVNSERTHYNNDNNSNNENKKSKEDFFKSLENPISEQENKKMLKAVKYIKDKFDYKNDNEVKAFLSRLKREGKLKEFGKQTEDYFNYIKLSKTDSKFVMKFKTWSSDWNNENWEKKVNSINPKKQKVSKEDQESIKRAQNLRISGVF